MRVERRAAVWFGEGSEDSVAGTVEESCRCFERSKAISEGLSPESLEPGGKRWMGSWEGVGGVVNFIRNGAVGVGEMGIGAGGARAELDDRRMRLVLDMFIAWSS
jgi:hypothetical protein